MLKEAGMRGFGKMICSMGRGKNFGLTILTTPVVSGKG